jgi:acetylornithine deacetylase/succinyl-diaminopimelate desuccinylase-like protein
VVPGEVSVDLDGRILPTFTPEALISELTAMARADSGAAFEVLNHDAGPEKPDLSLFETLEAVLKEVDPDGLPVPMLMPAATDGRLFARLGIQTYGVLPMRLPQNLDFTTTIHGPNERIPTDAIRFGTEAIYSLLILYGRGTDGPSSQA